MGLTAVEAWSTREGPGLNGCAVHFLQITFMVVCVVSLRLIKLIGYLSFLQGGLTLLLTADEGPGAPEYSIPRPNLLSKGCWEEADPVLDEALVEQR